MPKFKNGSPIFYETQRNNVRILIEKIGEKIDPCKIYPLAGPCQLVHCHYKCTVYYDELYWSDYPIPFNHVDHKVEVVYLDKDHLRRCGGPENVDRPPAPIGVNPTLNAGNIGTRHRPDVLSSDELPAIGQRGFGERLGPTGPIRRRTEFSRADRTAVSGRPSLGIGGLARPAKSSFSSSKNGQDAYSQLLEATG